MNLGALAWVMPDGGSAAVRRWSREATGRLGVGFWPILQTAVAASLAWFLASALLGHERPYFAAIAAVISSGVVVGQEGRRVIELVFGVACGLAVADLLVVLIGTGTVQIGVVVALAMAVAWLLGGGPALVSEAVNAARTLQNRPANDLTPEALAARAGELEGVTIEVLDRAGIEAAGMGAFACVAQGSVVEPRLPMIGRMSVL